MPVFGKGNILFFVVVLSTVFASFLGRGFVDGH